MQNLNILLVSIFRTVFPQASVALNKTLNSRKKCTGSYSADFTDRQTVLFWPVSAVPLTCAEVPKCPYFCWYKRKEKPAFQSATWWMIVCSLLFSGQFSCQKRESTKKLLLMLCPHRLCPAQSKPDPSHAELSLYCLAKIGWRKYKVWRQGEIQFLPALSPWAGV